MTTIPAPTPTPSPTPSPSPAPTPTPSSSSSYQRIAELTNSQSFDATCLGDLGSTGGGNFPGGISYNPANGNISYTLPGQGTRSFTATDQYTNTLDTSDYRQQSSGRSDFIAVRSAFNAVRPQYARAVTIDVQTTTSSSNAGTGTVRCVIGMPTYPDDLPRSAVTFSTLGVTGIVSSQGSVMPLTSVSGTLSINLPAQAIQADLTFYATSANGATVAYGPIRFSTNYDGMGGTFAGVIPLENGTYVEAAGSLFGPAGHEVGVTFKAPNGLTGQLFGTR